MKKISQAAKKENNSYCTMQELAEECKLSTITISRVFKTPEKVKEQTRNHVLQVAKEMNYVYNAFAGRLGSTQNQPMLGIIGSTVSDYLFQQIIETLRRATSANNLDMLLSLTSFDTKQELAILNRYHQYRVQGVVVYNPTYDFVNSGSLFSNPYCPSLLLWEDLEEDKGNFIGVDTRKNVRMCTEYLIRLGHKKIAIAIGNYSKIYRAHLRFQGYIETLKDFDIPFNENYLYSFPIEVSQQNMRDKMEIGRKAAYDLLTQKDKATAIIVPSDEYAIGVMSMANELDINIPEGLSLISMDELGFSRNLSPALTTMRVPYDKIGEKVIGFISNKLQKNETNYRRRLSSELIIRDSCATPKEV